MNIENKLNELKNIIKGGCNYIINESGILDSDSIIKKYKADLKLKKCLSCSLYDNDVCNDKKEEIVVCDFEYKGENRKKGEVKKGCGCFIPMKILSNSKCPIGKFENI